MQAVVLWDKTRSFWDIKNSLSHERGSKRSERSGGRERSEQSGASKRVSGASERANGRASGPVLQSVFMAVFDHSGFEILENWRIWNGNVSLFRNSRSWISLMSYGAFRIGISMASFNINENCKSFQNDYPYERAMNDASRVTSGSKRGQVVCMPLLMYQFAC